MSRYRLTFAVALTLTATYQLYAQWAEAFTRIESPAVRAKSTAPIAPPQETFAAIAQQFLPQVDWMRKPGYTFQRGDELFIFAGTAEPNRDEAARSQNPGVENQIKLEPFALIWIDPKRTEARPLLIQCDTARLQFEKPVKLGFDGSSPGRLTAAWFDGLVDITGPDGLRLQGQNFKFSEESLNLYSDYPVTFAYGPTDDNSSRVRGTAEQLQVDFATSTDPKPDPAMPRIGAIHRIRLLKQIVLDCDYEEQRDDDQPEPASAHISCDELLEFDATKSEATIVTFLKNVYVRRPTGGDKRPDVADTLRCHQLALRFVEREPLPAPVGAESEAVEADTEGPGPESSPAGELFSGLHVEQVVATSSDLGDRVVLRSDAQRIAARMETLQYDVGTRAAVLSVSEPNAAVEVNRAGTELRSQVIHVASDPQSRSQVFTCLGRGLLQHPDPDTGGPLLEATWTDRMHAAPDPATGLLLVQWNQDVKLVVQQRAGIRADELNVWIDDSGLQQDAADNVFPLPGPGEQLTAASRNRLPIRYVEARGGVIMASAESRVETEWLQAEVKPGKLAFDSEGENRSAGDERPAHAGRDESWQLNSQRVFLTLLNGPQTREVQIAEARADGNVEILQTVPAGHSLPAERESVSLSGAHLELVNNGDTHQVVTITGAPALLRRGRFLLECRNLQLDRAANRTTVYGAGLLQAPVDRDMNGEELTEPMILDVKWEEGLTFDGGLAAFRKMVKLQLHDSVLQCDEMDVRLDEPMRFSDARRDPQAIAIRDVSCRNGVQVEIYDWKENRIVGIRKARLTQFLLDYQSGAFQGDGPGKINHWSQQEGRRIAIANRKKAQANVAAESDRLEWEHISVEFDDLLLGNFKDRTAELHGRVRTIYAPVGRISETFVRDDLSGTSPSVEHAVWLGCDAMNIELHPLAVVTEGEKRTGYQLVIAAEGRCEMEGRQFQAKAASLSYEESKSLFTLRGKGVHEASIYYQEPGAEPRWISGKNIWFAPSEEGSKIRLEGSRGFQGSQ